LIVRGVAAENPWKLQLCTFHNAHSRTLNDSARGERNWRVPSPRGS
jgi:hypothetical protein